MIDKLNYEQLLSEIKGCFAHLQTISKDSVYNQCRSKLDAYDQAILLLSPDGRILICNQAMKILIGKNEAEILGRHCYEVIHNILEHIEGCPFKRMLKSHQQESEVFKIGDSEYDVVVNPILSEEGALQAGLHLMFRLNGISGQNV